MDIIYTDPESLMSTDVAPAAIDKTVRNFFEKFDDVIVGTDIGKGEFTNIYITGANQDLVKEAKYEFYKYVQSGNYAKDVKQVGSTRTLGSTTPK